MQPRSPGDRFPKARRKPRPGDVFVSTEGRHYELQADGSVRRVDGEASEKRAFKGLSARQRRKRVKEMRRRRSGNAST